MNTRRTLLVSLIFSVGYLAGSYRTDGTPELLASVHAAPPAQATADQVFELRTYTAAEGKHEALLTRFRDHTMRIFEKHGMTNIGYWTPQDAPLSENTLVYLIAHASRDAADASWAAFGVDPEWQAVAEESQRDGRLITGLERMYLEPTDFSPIR